MTVAETSLFAYNSILKTLSRRQLEVLRTIRKHGPLSNKEIAAWQFKEINKITGRTNELVKKSLVQQHGTKIIDGYPAKTWEATYAKELF